MADHAVKNKVKKLIFFSSGSVYGLKKEKSNGRIKIKSNFSL